MTPQEIYNRTKAHLLAQGPALDEDDNCRYRTRDGKRCAIGYWIPDEDYKSDMECRDLRTLLYVSLFKLPDWFNKQEDLLCELQGAHDDAAAEALQEFDISRPGDPHEYFQKKFKEHLLDNLLAIAGDHGLVP